MKIIAALLLLSCTRVVYHPREVTLVKKEKTIESMHSGVRLTFSDGTVRYVNRSQDTTYHIGRCYIIK